MIAFPNAKINLGLNILRKREDGFHELETVFYPVNFCDAIELMESPEFKFTTSGLAVSGNMDDNLCVKACRILQEKYPLPSFHIHLHKAIPMGAGLGGGSADAAFVLKLINEKFHLQISDVELEKFAATLGSDCAFFIRNKPALGTGRGEVLNPIELNLKGYKIVLVFPELHISTALAYSLIQPKTPSRSLRSIISSEIANWKEQLINDFEIPIFEKYPALMKIKNDLHEAGAIYAAMSGSGSTLFGIFPDEKEIKLQPGLRTQICS